jgi:hypothetical protein
MNNPSKLESLGGLRNDDLQAFKWEIEIELEELIKLGCKEYRKALSKLRQGVFDSEIQQFRALSVSDAADLLQALSRRVSKH